MRSIARNSNPYPPASSVDSMNYKRNNKGPYKIGNGRFDTLPVNEEKLKYQHILEFYDPIEGNQRKEFVDQDTVDILTKNFQGRGYSEMAVNWFQHLIRASEMPINKKSKKFIYDPRAPSNRSWHESRSDMIQVNSKIANRLQHQREGENMKEERRRGHGISVKVLGSADELIQRMRDIMAQFDAGNNNITLFNELREITDLLLEKGYITSHQHKQLYNKYNLMSY